MATITNSPQSLMQAAEAIVKAIDRLKKEVKPTAAEIPSSAISEQATVEEALENLDERLTVEETIQTPTQPTYDTTKVDSSSSTYYLTVRRVGKIVFLAGGFVATTDISVSSPETIATGLPKAITSSQGSIIAMNSTKKQPVALAVTTGGQLQTYYSGETIESGNTVRFSSTYLTTDE